MESNSKLFMINYPKTEFSSEKEQNKDIPKEKDDELASATLPRYPFYILLRLLGALPFNITPEGQPKFKLLSPLFAYSLSVYITVMFFLSRELSTRFSELKDAGVGEKVDSLMYLVFHLNYVVVPVFMWLPIRRLARHQERWYNFQLDFKRITNRPLKYELQRYTRVIAIFIPIVSFLGALFWIMINSPEQPWLVVLFMVPAMTNLVFGGLWCISYILLAVTAEKICTMLKLRLNRLHTSDAHPGKAVRLLQDYRYLWLELSRLLHSSNDMSSVTFSYHATQVFLFFTLALYGVLSKLNVGSWNHTQLVRSIACLICLAELLAVANTAHYTTVKFDAVNWDPYWVIADSNFHPDVQKEIGHLLEAASVSPQIIDVGGFTEIDRTWVTNILGNLLSSLTILVQFTVSEDQKISTDL